MEAGASAGRKAGGRVASGTSSVRFSPYARPASGSGSRPIRASGLSTPGLPQSAPSTAQGVGGLSPQHATQQTVTGTLTTPSTFNRILTPLKAAGGFFLGQVGSLLGSRNSPGSQSSPSPGADWQARVDIGSSDKLQSPSNVVLPGNGRSSLDSPGEVDEAELSLDPTGLPSNEDPQETATSRGSLLASLKQSPLRSMHGYRLGPVDQEQNGGAIPPMLSATATPYSSVLELLREGPSRPHQLQQASGHQEVAQASNPEPLHRSGQRYQTPAIAARTPRGLPPRGDGLFTMGMTPTSGIAARHRSSVRSAFAKRTPDSAAPMLTFGERWATPSKPGQLPNGGGPTTSTPAWTPMRRSTMALVEQYEQKDATSSKRSRSSPPSSHSGTPMVGSGISSLRSFAIQPSVYRRRVRPRNEPTALPQPASLPPPEQLSSTDDKATPKTKLTTETARRILMTLDSLATKPSASLPASRKMIISTKASSSKKTDEAASLSLPAKSNDIKSRLTFAGPLEGVEDASKQDSQSLKAPAPSVAPKDAAAPSSGGWGAAFLQANAASSQAAAEAAAEEIAKQSGGSRTPPPSSTAFSFGIAKSPAALENTTEDAKATPASVGFEKQPGQKADKAPVDFPTLPGKSSTSHPAAGVFSFPTSATTAPSSKPSVSFTSPVASGSSAIASLEPAIKSGSHDALKPVQKRVSFAPETEVLVVTPQSTPQAQFTTKPAIKGPPVPAGILSVDKPFGGQSPIFSFGGPRNTKEEAAIKEATSGCNPQGIEPVFLFGSASSLESSRPPTASMPLSKEVQEMAEKTVKEAAAMPLPDEEDEDEPETAAGVQSAEPTPAPAPSSGGWGAAFLAANAATAQDTAAAVQKEIEQKKSSSGLTFDFGSTAADKPANPMISTASPETSPVVTSTPVPGLAGSAAASSGWGTAFLQQNQSANSAAAKAIEKEIEKNATPTQRTAVTFSFGGKPADATPATKHADPTPAAETAPAASGWGAGFLAANQSQASRATAAAEEAIKEASLGSVMQPSSTVSAPTFSFGAPPGTDSAALTASGPSTGLFSAASQPATTPATTFTFGAAAPADAGAATSAASAPVFSFGAVNSAPGSSPAFSFGASAPASAPAPVFGSSAVASASTPSTGFGAASSAAHSFGSAAVGATPSGFGSAAASAPAFVMASASDSKDPEQPSTQAASSMSFGTSLPAPTLTFGGSSAGTTPPSAALTPSTFGASTAPSFGGSAAVPGFGAVTSGGITPTPAAPSFGAGATPASFGAPPVTFGSAASAPAFGAAPSPASAPTFAFGAGAPPAEASPPPTFAFGASSAAPAPAAIPAPASFGGTFGQQQQPQAPAPGFGGAQAQGGFSFGASAASAPSFGAQAAGFGQQQPAPAFGGAVPGAAAPSFAFGAGAQSQAAAPAFGGQPPAAAPGGFTMGGGDTQQGGSRRVVKVRRNRRGR